MEADYVNYSLQQKANTQNKQVILATLRFIETRWEEGVHCTQTERMINLNNEASTVYWWFKQK